MSKFINLLLSTSILLFSCAEEPTPPPEKSDLEVYHEIGKDLYDIGSEMNERHKERKAQKLANREKHFVYQIGTPISGEEELRDAYEALEEKKINGLKIFKKSRKSFLIVKDDNIGSEEELVSSLEDIRLITGERVKVIDLLDECPLRKEISRAKDLKFKNPKREMECWVCE